MCVSFLLLQVEKSGETPEKEQIELKEGEEKKDDSTEKDKKKKKEKKVKEPKEKGPNCIDLISKDLDLGNRDSNNVNVEIDVSHACTAHFKTLKEGGNNDEGKGSSRVCAIFMKQQLHPHRVMTFFLSIFFFFWLLPSKQLLLYATYILKKENLFRKTLWLSSLRRNRGKEIFGLFCSVGVMMSNCPVRLFYLSAKNELLLVTWTYG